MPSCSRHSEDRIDDGRIGADYDGLKFASVIH
jgi:hypothetical protein